MLNFCQKVKFRGFQIFKKCSKYLVGEIIMKLGIDGGSYTDRPWWADHKKDDSMSKVVYGFF